jgi:hypothetical protein
VARRGSVERPLFVGVARFSGTRELTGQRGGPLKRTTPTKIASDRPNYRPLRELRSLGKMAVFRRILVLYVISNVRSYVIRSVRFTSREAGWKRRLF